MHDAKMDPSLRMHFCEEFGIDFNTTASFGVHVRPIVCNGGVSG